MKSQKLLRLPFSVFVVAGGVPAREPRWAESAAPPGNGEPLRVVSLPPNYLRQDPAPGVDKPVAHLHKKNILFLYMLAELSPAGSGSGRW